MRWLLPQHYYRLCWFITQHWLWSGWVSIRRIGQFNQWSSLACPWARLWTRGGLHWWPQLGPRQSSKLRLPWSGAFVLERKCWVRRCRHCFEFALKASEAHAELNTDSIASAKGHLFYRHHHLGVWGSVNGAYQARWLRRSCFDGRWRVSSAFHWMSNP